MHRCGWRHKDGDDQQGAADLPERETRDPGLWEPLGSRLHQTDHHRKQQPVVVSADQPGSTVRVKSSPFYQLVIYFSYRSLIYKRICKISLVLILNSAWTIQILIKVFRLDDALIFLFVFRGPPRRPPPAVQEQVKSLNQSLRLGHLLCRSRNPDFLLNIIQRQVMAVCTV